MNAVIHAFEFERSGKLIIRVQCVNEAVSIAFVDNGRGIPVENLGKVFDPFFTTRRGQGGTGLGLHIVFNIVTKQLSGTITAQSNMQQGACFTVSIPRITPTAS